MEQRVLECTAKLMKDGISLRVASGALCSLRFALYRLLTRHEKLEPVPIGI
jgi:hypothetical protein